MYLRKQARLMGLLSSISIVKSAWRSVKMIQQESAFNWYYIIFIFILISIDIKESNRIDLCIETARHILYLYFCRSSPAATRKREFMLFWTAFRRVLSEASSHFIRTLCRNSPTDQCVQRPFPQQVKSIIDSHLKEEALLTVHSQFSTG